MRDGHLLRRAGREFAKNLIWMVVAFGALAAILVATTALPLVGARAFVGAATALMSAIVTGVVIGSNATMRLPSVGSSTTIPIPEGRPAPVAIGPMVGEGRVALALLVTFIQRSAWKANSQKARPAPSREYRRMIPTHAKKER